MENPNLIKQPIYTKEAVIVTFWEMITHPIDGPEGQFKKRYYTSEDKAKDFIERLVNSGRNVSAIQLKINYKIEVK